MGSCSVKLWCVCFEKDTISLQGWEGRLNVGSARAAVQDWVSSGGGEGFCTGIVARERNAKTEYYLDPSRLTAGEYSCKLGDWGGGGRERERERAGEKSLGFLGTDFDMA